MTTLSKNVYFDVLYNIVNKYNGTVHRTIKMKPTDVTSDSYVEYNEGSNLTKPKFKVCDHLGFYYLKTFLLKDTLKVSQKKFLLLVKFKIQFHGHT